MWNKRKKVLKIGVCPMGALAKPANGPWGDRPARDRSTRWNSCKISFNGSLEHPHSDVA
jgi:hypothetical protein